jgi:acyl-coenzyme A synthetase/AMP-(fatty) acid ligase
MPIDEKTLLIGEHFKYWGKVHPNSEFLIDWASGKGERRFTYKQTAENVYRLCWALKDLGLKKGDMVTSLAYGSIEMWEVMLSNFFTGYVYGCQNPDLPDDWLVAIINDRMAAKVVFFDDEYRDKVKRLMPRFKSVQHYICVDGPSEDSKILNYHELISKCEPKEVEVEVKPDDLHALYMSGGTTGIPKAAMWTYEADYWNSVYAYITYEVGPEDVGQHHPPPFWSSNPKCSVLPAILRGTSVCIFRGRFFEPGVIELWCEAVGKERIKWGLVPAIWFLEIAKWPEEKWRKYDLSSLVSPVVWGMEVPYPVWKTNYERWGITGMKFWDACEAGGGTYLSSWTMLKHFKEGKERPFLSFGKSMGGPTLVRLVDSEGNDVPLGEIGEMIVKGPNMAYDYLGEHERWLRRYKEGWLYTGDMFRMDEDGYFYMVGKREDIGTFPIDKDGKYVMPYPIVDEVTGMGKVIEAIPIAVPDPEYKAKYRIIVRPVEGVELSADEVTKVATKVAPDYVINDVIIRKEPLTKTATGKIIVTALAKEYGGIIPEE